MNMIWHNHEGMQKIVPKYAGVVPYGFHDHVCNRRLAQIERSNAGFVQQSIHRGKCLSGVQRLLRKSSVWRQTIVETPSEENWPVRLVDVRKSPAIEGHTGLVPPQPWNSPLRPANQGVPRMSSPKAAVGRTPGSADAPVAHPSFHPTRREDFAHCGPARPT